MAGFEGMKKNPIAIGRAKSLKEQEEEFGITHQIVSDANGCVISLATSTKHGKPLQRVPGQGKVDRNWYESSQFAPPAFQVKQFFEEKYRNIPCTEKHSSPERQVVSSSRQESENTNVATEWIPVDFDDENMCSAFAQCDYNPHSENPIKKIDETTPKKSSSNDDQCDIPIPVDPIGLEEFDNLTEEQKIALSKDDAQPIKISEQVLIDDDAVSLSKTISAKELGDSTDQLSSLSISETKASNVSSQQSSKISEQALMDDNTASLSRTICAKELGDFTDQLSSLPISETKANFQDSSILSDTCDSIESNLMLDSVSSQSNNDILLETEKQNLLSSNESLIHSNIEGKSLETFKCLDTSDSSLASTPVSLTSNKNNISKSPLNPLSKPFEYKSNKKLTKSPYQPTTAYFSTNDESSSPLLSDPFANCYSVQPDLYNLPRTSDQNFMKISNNGGPYEIFYRPIGSGSEFTFLGYSDCVLEPK